MEIIFMVIAAIVAVWWFGFGKTVESLAVMSQSSVEMLADKQAVAQTKYYTSSKVDLAAAVVAARTRHQLRMTRVASLDDLEEMLEDIQYEQSTARATRRAKREVTPPVTA